MALIYVTGTELDAMTDYCLIAPGLLFSYDRIFQANYGGDIMDFCPSITLIGKIGKPCVATPVLQDSQLARSQKFAEEMTFSAALFHQFHVRQIPDAGLVIILNRLWLKMKKRRVTKKEKSEQLWFRKRHPEEHKESFED
ncbi:MAG: hypothetical protein ACPGEF_05835 [Endozoicomonas sp.]